MKHYYRVSRSNKNQIHKLRNNVEFKADDINYILALTGKKIVLFLYIVYTIICLFFALTFVYFLIISNPNFYDFIVVSFFIGAFLFFAFQTFKVYKKTRKQKELYVYGITIIVISTILGLLASVLTILNFIVKAIS